MIRRAPTLQVAEQSSIGTMQDWERKGTKAMSDEVSPLGDDAQCGEEVEKESAATRLIKMAQVAEFFHTENGECFARFQAGSHQEISRITAKRFRHWLTLRYYDAYSKAPGSQALRDALATLEAQSLHRGVVKQVHVRVAEYDDAYWLDLCDPLWRAVKITPDGWEVVENPPVNFRRSPSAASLPIPARGGSLANLFKYINVSDADRPLILGWLVGTISPKGPYAILSLSGEQGSAKSTTARLLRSLADPAFPDQRTLPREERDLCIGALGQHVLAFDNVSGLQNWLSDAICRLATGGGFATRELYSDSDEILIQVCKPVILNGIEDLGTRSDLLDRSILIHLPSIPENARKVERDITAAFESERPYLLGALLDAVVSGLQRRDSIQLAEKPRMADFAHWVTACERGLGLADGDFIAAYRRNRGQIHELAIENNLVAVAVLSFIEQQSTWRGTAKELLKDLEVHDPDSAGRPGWPKTGHHLSGQLKRLAPNLRAKGLKIAYEREGGTGKRLIKLEMVSE